MYCLPLASLKKISCLGEMRLPQGCMKTFCMNTLAVQSVTLVNWRFAQGRGLIQKVVLFVRGQKIDPVMGGPHHTGRFLSRSQTRFPQ